MGLSHVTHTGPQLLEDYPMLPTLVPNSWGTHALSLPAPSQGLNISPFILFFLFEAGSLYVTLAVLELCM